MPEGRFAAGQERAGPTSVRYLDLTRIRRGLVGGGAVVVGVVVVVVVVGVVVVVVVVVGVVVVGVVVDVEAIPSRALRAAMKAGVPVPGDNSRAPTSGDAPRSAAVASKSNG
jgi:hypothetical protein